MSPKQVNEAISLLFSPDIEQNVLGIRRIKNLIIGNKTNKVLLVKNEAVATMAKLLFNPMVDEDTRENILVALGSLAYGNNEAIDQLWSLSAVSAMIQYLRHQNLKIVEASARTLRIVLQKCSTISLNADECHLITVLAENARDPSSINLRISEIAAGIIARITLSLKETMAQAEIEHLIANLMNYLDEKYSFYPKLQEATLDALASLCKDWSNACKEVVQNQESVRIIQDMTRNSRSSMRLLACTCLTNIIKSKQLPATTCMDVALNVLPTLIRLFQDDSTFENTAGYGNATIQEKAPLVFANLVGESDSLQKWAKDADAITKLTEIVEQTTENETIEETKKSVDELMFPKPKFLHSSLEKRRESAFLAIAAVCSLREECRKQVIDAKLLPQIVASLEHSNVGIRAAACSCCRSLSRSVKNLRTALVDAGVALPLVKLLSDSDTQVKVTATATLCNIVLDFSPMKKTVLENGGAEMLVGLINSTQKELRLNAVWALKNLLYQAESEIKEKVMNLLTWPGILKLLGDSEVSVKEQAVNLLRNLACGKENDIDHVIQGIGADSLVQFLILTLNETNEELIMQSLYTIVNIVTGTSVHKDLVMNANGLLERINVFLLYPKAAIRIAAVWCVINLTWREEVGALDRIAKLVQLGVEEKLVSLRNDADLDVRDRVKTALSHFQSGTVPDAGGGTGPSVPHSSSDTSLNEANRQREAIRQRIMQQSNDDMDLMDTTDRESMFGFTALGNREDYFDEDEV